MRKKLNIGKPHILEYPYNKSLKKNKLSKYLWAK